MTGLRKIYLFLTCVTLQQFETAFGDERWDYGDHGPHTDAWCRKSATCCEGTYQTPINLDKKFGKLLGKHDLEFQNYDKEMKMFGLNNGHTVVFSQDPKSNNKIQPMISKGGLGATYVFHSLHFHWGSQDSIGSEHFLNGRQFPLELHLVHYRSDFPGFADAVQSKQSNALAVLGVFYTLSSGPSSPAMQAISQSLPNILKPSQTTNLDKTIKLIDLLPRIKNCMFRYLGSLTIPDCNEVVAWTVFGSQQRITKCEMNNFRKLQGEDSKSMNDNYRPLQNLGNRELQAYGKKCCYSDNK